MTNILVTFISENMIEKDLELPNDVMCVHLVEKLIEQMPSSNPLEANLYNVEFSLNKEEWQKVDNHYRLYEVGVWDGVYLRLVKNSRTLSAPRVSFVSAEEENTHAFAQGELGTHSLEQIREEVKSKEENAWKVIE
ncbi:hypothetical protein [Priestia aryabhattai]|uniref:hypothetical protein n=1 Tax=Priestia aryabhattai TaxID=412384 RepID=UPI00048CBC0F|nr:hypothetical protein [Priestia aryabhattai]